MSTEFQVIVSADRRATWTKMFANACSTLVVLLGIFASLLFINPGVARAQTPTPAPRTSPSPLPPNAAGSVVRPTNETQQSTQPQTGPQQQQQQTTPNKQGPRPTTPQTPGQDVGIAPGVAPADLPDEPPPIAPNYEAPLRPLPSAERVGVNVSDQAPLTLNDAIRMALKDSNDIDQSRIDVQIAEYNLRAAQGIYDPLVSSENYYERSTTPTSSSIGGAGASGAFTEADTTGAARLAGFSPFGGGLYQLDFSSSRLTTTNQNARLNPQFPAAATLTYTQPLVRGLRFDINRRNIEIAKKNLSLTDAQFRQRAIDVIAQVEQAYWDLAFALRNLQVQIDAVKQARLQVESNQRLVAKGVLAPIEIVAATTQVTTFEQNVYTAQESVTQAENVLKTLILADRAQSLWTRAIVPVTPVILEAPRVPLEFAVKAALDNRPELAQLRSSADINQINVRYFRDQTKPQVDLVGTYTTVGLAGSPVQSNSNPTSNTSVLTARVNELSALAGLPPLPPSTSTPIPPTLVGGYTKSLRNLIEQNYPTVRVGVRISLPLRNRTAEANLGGALALGNRITDQFKQTEQIIEAEVRNSMQAVRSGEARLAAAAASRSSAEQQFQSEQRQFRAGTSTVFLVLQRQTDLLAARGRELQAQTDLNKAISLLQRATGNTLTANHISVRTDTPLRELEQRPQPAEGAASMQVPSQSANSFTKTQE
jgi:outer membrane protein TolC